MQPSRRALLASIAVMSLPGCAAPLQPLSSQTTQPDAQTLLAESADAHGQAALAGMTDISVSFAGEWRSVVARLQPDLTDTGFRGASQERLLLRERLLAQAYTGPSGRKQVVRRWVPGSEGETRVWFNGVATQGADPRAAAALVADGYSLFLLGPMLLAGQWAADRSLLMELAGVERIAQDGRDYECDVLRVRMAPGLGFSERDELALFIDREQRLMRRVRFTLDGLESTRGAVAEVDTFVHRPLHGVQWPTRFHERLLRPLPLPVHDWRLTGLDVDRGLVAAELDGSALLGKAGAPAATLS